MLRLSSALAAVVVCLHFQLARCMPFSITVGFLYAGDYQITRPNVLGDFATGSTTFSSLSYFIVNSARCTKEEFVSFSASTTGIVNGVQGPNTFSSYLQVNIIDSFIDVSYSLARFDALKNPPISDLAQTYEISCTTGHVFPPNSISAWAITDEDYLGIRGSSVGDSTVPFAALVFTAANTCYYSTDPNSNRCTTEEADNVGLSPVTTGCNSYTALYQGICQCNAVQKPICGEKPDINAAVWEPIAARTIPATLSCDGGTQLLNAKCDCTSSSVDVATSCPSSTDANAATWSSTAGILTSSTSCLPSSGTFLHGSTCACNAAGGTACSASTDPFADIWMADSATPATLHCTLNSPILGGVCGCNARIEDVCLASRDANALTWAPSGPVSSIATTSTSCNSATTLFDGQCVCSAPSMIGSYVICELPRDPAAKLYNLDGIAVVCQPNFLLLASVCTASTDPNAILWTAAPSVGADTVSTACNAHTTLFNGLCVCAVISGPVIVNGVPSIICDSPLQSNDMNLLLWKAGVNAITVECNQRTVLNPASGLCECQAFSQITFLSQAPLTVCSARVDDYALFWSPSSTVAFTTACVPNTYQDPVTNRCLCQPSTPRGSNQLGPLPCHENTGDHNAILWTPGATITTLECNAQSTLETILGVAICECNPGFSGAPSDICIACLSGSFSSTIGGNCQACPGKGTGNATCTTLSPTLLCAATTDNPYPVFQPTYAADGTTVLSTDCVTICQAGFYQEPNTSGCFKTLPGYYSNGANNQATMCSAGTFAAGLGSTACTPCDPFFFQVNAGATVCDQKCPVLSGTSGVAACDAKNGDTICDASHILNTLVSPPACVATSTSSTSTTTTSPTSTTSTSPTSSTSPSPSPSPLDAKNIPGTVTLVIGGATMTITDPDLNSVETIIQNNGGAGTVYIDGGILTLYVNNEDGAGGSVTVTETLPSGRVTITLPADPSAAVAAAAATKVTAPTVSPGVSTITTAIDNGSQTVTATSTVRNSALSRAFSLSILNALSLVLAAFFSLA